MLESLTNPTHTASALGLDTQDIARRCDGPVGAFFHHLRAAIIQTVVVSIPGLLGPRWSGAGRALFAICAVAGPDD